jgi:hypothetical protein
MHFLGEALILSPCLLSYLFFNALILVYINCTKDYTMQFHTYVYCTLIRLAPSIALFFPLAPTIFNSFQ